MNKFRKKPVVIEAFQMTLTTRWNNSDWPEWLNEAWNMEAGEEGALFIDPDDSDGVRLVIGTLEGCLLVGWFDWIIRGVQGELYPCKDDIFRETYDEEPED